MDGDSGLENIFAGVLGLFAILLWAVLGYSRSWRAGNDTGGADSLDGHSDGGHGGDGGDGGGH